MKTGPGKYCLKCESFKTIPTILILIMFVRLLAFIEEKRKRERERERERERLSTPI